MEVSVYLFVNKRYANFEAGAFIRIIHHNVSNPEFEPGKKKG